jgi:hypothetical protein
MRFDKHLFISYSHIDNQPLTPQQQGWITRFHESISALLSMRIGRKAEIWRDDKLRGNDIFGDEILSQFGQTAMLISVLTPRYLASEWCTREIREFCTKADQLGGIAILNKARIFKVLKAPVDTQEGLPDIVKQLIGYDFFTYEDGAPLELDPVYGEKFAQDYNRKIGKLAWDVSQMLKSLEAAESQSPALSLATGASAVAGSPAASAAAPAPSQAAPARTVYLAECSHDRRDVREMLEADLKLHGYTILPDRRLPLEDERAYVDGVIGLIDKCSLSIHLVGAAHGTVPDGPSQKSIVSLQNDIAARRSQSAGFPRLIWLPAGTHSDQAAQQAFIDALHADPETQRGADLITGDIEEVKAAIHAALKKLETPARPPAPAASAQGAAGLVYLVCDQKDRQATVPLRKWLKAQGVDVTLPAFEGSAAAVRDANQHSLTICDAVLVFYGAGDEAWKRTTDNELKKLRGVRPGASMPAMFTYLAAPATSDKQDLVDMEERGVIDSRSAFRESDLTPIMAAMPGIGAS